MAMSRVRVDWFLVAIVGAAVTASFLPVRGAGVPVFANLSRALIFVLFYLYGVRLEPREVLAGLKHWRLHSVILSFTFVVFPLIGLGLGLVMPGLIGAELYRGLLWVCLVPSTVQSSVNFTSIARGNVAGAVVAASTSNLLGVLITPLLAVALMGVTGMHLQFGSVVDIAGQILLPFALGQLTRGWTKGFVTRHRRLKLVDQASIVVIVYDAFSAGVRAGIWGQVSIRGLAVLVLVELALLALMLWLTWHTAGWLGFNHGDQIAIQFCGTKKSLATGVPMASALFTGGAVGLIVLPLMIFHQAQLMACGALASRYARQTRERESATADE